MTQSGDETALLVGLSRHAMPALVAGIFAVLMLASARADSQPPAAPSVPAKIAADYVHPHALIDIGKGRKMNLFCMGQGSRTVIFDSGLSDWSSIWALVQPAVAAHARACTYDRAGMGYSDPSDQPRSPIAIVEDLHKLIHAAKIATPVVLVGHSLGGFNMKLYAALYPSDVDGLVLVDPAEERIFPRTRVSLRAKYGNTLAAKLELQSLTSRSHAVSEYEECAAAAWRHDLDPKSDFYKQCSDPVRAPLGPVIAAERQKLQVRRAYQDAQASEFVNSVNADPRPVMYILRFFQGVCSATNR
jgi:pimeloyl-ACP methyl ester carboxylesterase